MLALFVADGTALLDSIANAPRPAGDDGGLLALTMSVLHMGREVERRVSHATFGEEQSRGYVLRLQKSINAPASSLIADLQEKSRSAEPASEEFFDFDEAQASTFVPSGREWIDNLYSEDELTRYEAIMNVAGSGMDAFLAELRERSGPDRDRLLEAVWPNADVVLLAARSRSRTLFDAAVGLAAADAVVSKWRTLYALFRKAGTSYWDPEVVRPMLESFSDGDRAVCARALISHPYEPYRRLALALLQPNDLWEVISNPATPAAWLLQLWRHVRPNVGRDYLKIFFVCVRDTLARPGPAERILSVVELVKEFYEVHAFHEDAFLRMLLDLDERVRGEARRHRLLIDFDAEYIERFRKFLIDGPRMEHKMEEWRSVPLAIQRKLARNGHFLKHFVCHPVDTIAMECLPHIKRLEDARTYLELYAINARLIGEISKEKNLFLGEESRFALVANPKTPAYVVLKYIGYLRRDNLKKLSESRECNQLSRNYAQKLLARRV